MLSRSPASCCKPRKPNLTDYCLYVVFIESFEHRRKKLVLNRHKCFRICNLSFFYLPMLADCRIMSVILGQL